MLNRCKTSDDVRISEGQVKGNKYECRRNENVNVNVDGAAIYWLDRTRYECRDLGSLVVTEQGRKNERE